MLLIWESCMALRAGAGRQGRVHQAVHGAAAIPLAGQKRSLCCPWRSPLPVP